jgi:hypothetical protein
MNQPQPQPTPLYSLLLNRVSEVELPAYVAAGLIVRSVCEDWTDAQFRHERFKAKWLYFFEHLRDVEVGEELPMLRDGQDEDC